MNCREIRAWLERDFDGAADPSSEAAAHLEGCAACRAEAGRLKAVAAAVRAALPAAEVPPGFAADVLAALEAPAADDVLQRLSRPRARRFWLPLVAGALLALPLFLLLGGGAFRGPLTVYRDGRWVDADHAESGETFGLRALAQAEGGGVRVKALAPSVVLAARPAELRAGEVLIEADEAAVVRTALGEISLREGSACLAALDPGKENDMGFQELNRIAPAVLTVTMLAGGGTVANAQGAIQAEAGGKVRVQRGAAPERIARELDAIAQELEGARQRIDDLERLLRATRGDVPPRVEVKDFEEFGTPSPPPPPARRAVSIPFSDPREPTDRLEKLLYHAREGNLAARLELVRERARIAEEQARMAERLRAIAEAVGDENLEQWEKEARELEEKRRKFLADRAAAQEQEIADETRARTEEQARAEARKNAKALAAYTHAVRGDVLAALKAGESVPEKTVKRLRTVRDIAWTLCGEGKTRGDEVAAARETYLELQGLVEAVEKLDELASTAAAGNDAQIRAELRRVRADLISTLAAKEK